MTAHPGGNGGSRLTLALRRALAVGLGTLVAVALVGASPAAAAGPTIAMGAGAAVQAEGAALVVDVVVTCPAGMDMTLFGRATQRRADGPSARGIGDQPVSCTGAPQTRRLALGAADPLLPFGPAEPFVAGPAFVTAVLIHCTDESCTEVRSHRTVRATAVTADAARFTSSVMTVHLPATARVEAAGAGVTVSLRYRCASGGSGTVVAALLQRTSPDGVTGASDGVTVTCTGQGRTGVLAFHEEAAAWRAGPAFVVLRGQVCVDSRCAPVHAHRTLTVS